MIKQIPTFVNRTYRGGKALMEFLGMDAPEDSFCPEDWISSFSEARNKVYIKNEGISKTEAGLITETVQPGAFGKGRTFPGVLVKLLDAGERLGIQVHPTREFSRRVFGVPYGKTESWHILGANDDACVYIGFREFITKELWKELYKKQDIAGMLDAMHCFKVKSGDTILVRGGTPHAIGSGCFLLEVQEPTDYTMRVEKVTAAGEQLSPMQIHYGAGEENLFDCFNYIPMTRAQAENAFFLKPRRVSDNAMKLIDYDDTSLFALEKVCGGSRTYSEDVCLTIISIADGGTVSHNGVKTELKRGDRFFIPAGENFTCEDAHMLVCYPPRDKS